MNRKLALIFMICTLFALMSSSATATGAINAKHTFDNDSNAIVISGTAQTVKDNTNFTLVVKDPDGVIVFTDQKVGVKNSDGVTEFKFEKFPFDINSKSGSYSFIVSGYKLGAANPITYINTDANTLLSLLQAVETNTVHTEFMKTNAESLSIDKKLIEGIGVKGTVVFDTLMNDVDYNLPADCETEAEYLQLIECAKQFRTDYFEIASISTFNDFATAAQMTNWLSTYDSIYNLSVDDLSTTQKENELYAYVEKAKSKTQMVTNLILSQLDTVDKVKARIYEKALLTAIETEHYSESSFILGNYSNLFPYNKALFDSLTYEEELSFYGDFAQKPYTTYSDATTKVDSIVAEIIANRHTPDGDGGGSGGGGGGGGMMPIVPKPSQTQYFDDIASVEWAKEAIEYLCEAEIISGKAENKFAPYDNITRAEFIKIITLALDIPMSSGEYFTDVSKSDWYYPYVYAAYDAGIVSGDELNRFNPKSNITRQDMAVILYRAYDIESSYNELSFTDSEQISTYARNAVAYFVKTSILNGMGNNMFSPKGNATRAQAAVIVHRSLKHFEG